MDLLHKLADLLLERETVQGNELDDLILEKEPDFEFPSKLDDDLVAGKVADAAARKEKKAAAEEATAAEPEEKKPADGDASADKTEE